MSRRVVATVVGILSLFALGTACTPHQVAVFTSLGPAEQDAVMSALRDQSSPSYGDCHSAVEGIWPEHAQGIAHNIVNRESGGSPTAQNRSSSAAGCFQIIQGTWNGIRPMACPWSMRYDARCNVETAWILYQREGTAPWRASA